MLFCHDLYKTMETKTNVSKGLKVDVEYWLVSAYLYPQNLKKSDATIYNFHGACDYGGHCLALAKLINEKTPSASIYCKRGRQGAFEVVVNGKLVYSKLQTMALPDYEEVVHVVKEVSQGMEPKEVKGQQPINCVIQ